MAETVKHYSKRRIDDTELQVIADVRQGVASLVRLEESVVREYARRKEWPHKTVTLFVLRDLQPLVRQIRRLGGMPTIHAEDLDRRPMVNVYDMADPAACTVFVNRRALRESGLWNEPEAIRGMLAHEHAHPLAENETTRAARRLGVELRVAATPSAPGSPARGSDESGARRRKRTPIPERWRRVERVLGSLIDKCCLHAPQEIFANELAIRAGFGEALLGLDRRTVAEAAETVKEREDLANRLRAEIAAGRLDPAEEAPLRLIGDVQGYAGFALEVAPFYRAGREGDARELEERLGASVFPHLAADAVSVYRALCERYRTLRPDLDPEALAAWCEGIVGTLAEALARTGLRVRFRVRAAGENERRSREGGGGAKDAR